MEPFVFRTQIQKHGAKLNYLSVEENIALPLLIKSGKNHLSKTEKEKLENLLEKLDLLKRRKHKPRQISGGQKQRTAIARALISEPELLLADEPTGNLDQNTGKQIIEILHNLCTEDKITMIIVTHDQKIAQKAHRVIQLEEGQMSKRLHTKKILG
jgi:ABC-type lipoprotein export system ATPase subunit